MTRDGPPEGRNHPADRRLGRLPEQPTGQTLSGYRVWRPSRRRRPARRPRRPIPPGRAGSRVVRRWNSILTPFEAHGNQPGTRRWCRLRHQASSRRRRRFTGRPPGGGAAASWLSLGRSPPPPPTCGPTGRNGRTPRPRRLARGPPATYPSAGYGEAASAIGGSSRLVPDRVAAPPVPSMRQSRSSRSQRLSTSTALSNKSSRSW
jgi:hypothetical protein